MPPGRGSDYLLTAGDRAAGMLELRFHWVEDRFSQAVSLVTEDAADTLLVSADTDDQQHWPPSPPLQQLLVEDRPSGPVALLVGMAGTSHWSASVERRSDPVGFQFDIACRVREHPVRLASTYRTDNLLVAVDGDCVAVGESRPREAGSQVIVRPISAQTAKLELRGRGTDLELSIHSCDAAAPPATVRWQYEIVIL